MTTNEMRAMRWTVEDILNKSPCEAYSRDRIEELFAGRDTLSYMDICDLPIPPDDIVWMLTRRHWPEWIEGIVDRAVRTHAVSCGIAVVEQWAVRWLDGSDRTMAAALAAEAAAARAAEEAAWAAEARAAAWAAWAAARAARAETRAAEEAAMAAAWAAEAAARAAARAAALAESAEMSQQVADARELLEIGE